MDAADVTSEIMSDLKSTASLSSITGLIAAGSITTEGVSTSGTETGAGETNSPIDWNRDVLDTLETSETASENETLTFGLHEVLNPNAMRLVFRDVDEDGNVDGKANPEDKLFVVEYLIKGAKVREIFPSCSFTSRGERSLSNEEADALSVTYSIKDGENGAFFKRIFRATP